MQDEDSGIAPGARPEDGPRPAADKEIPLSEDADLAALIRQANALEAWEVSEDDSALRPAAGPRSLADILRGMADGRRL